MKLLKAVKNFLIDWVWQLPQNIIGILYKKYLGNSISNRMYDSKNNCYIYIKDSNGGVTLGKYIFVYKRYKDLNWVINHETGHVKQSRILGPLYLFIIGIPSIIWAATHRKIAPNKDYYWLYTESWANKLAGL